MTAARPRPPAQELLTNRTNEIPDQRVLEGGSDFVPGHEEAGPWSSDPIPEDGTATDLYIEAKKDHRVLSPKPGMA